MKTSEVGSERSNIHLDTTIVTDWLLKGAERRQTINDKLARFRGSTTSRYVKAEFKKGPLGHLVYLHNKLVQMQSFAQLFGALGRLPPPQDRRLRTLLEQLQHFFSLALPRLASDAQVRAPISPDDYLRRMAISYLANLIELSWTDFDTVAKKVIDPQQCFPSMTGPQRAGPLYDISPRSCDKSIPPCGCRRFFKEHSDDLRAIRAALSSASNPDAETIDRLRSIRELLRKPNRLEQHDCWRCGDAVVAMEAPPGSAIFNNNQKHFGPICKALRRPMVTY